MLLLTVGRKGAFGQTRLSGKVTDTIGNPLTPGHAPFPTTGNPLSFSVQPRISRRPTFGGNPFFPLLLSRCAKLQAVPVKNIGSAY